MPTRLLRTSTIASIADFGASAGNPAAAAGNALAFRNALAAGFRRIAIPPGQWYFREILYLGLQWLPPDIEIFGEGAAVSILRYAPLDDTIPALWFHTGASGFARSTIRDLQLIGPVLNAIDVRPVGIGIRFNHALFCRVRDVRVEHFEVGVDFNDGAVDTYSGYNVLERFEINNCVTGIRARDATNGNTVQNGRIYWSLYLDTAGTMPPVIQTEEGTGIDIVGTTSVSGPAGSAGCLLSGLQVETAVTCVRVVNSHETTISGCYLEAGRYTGPAAIIATMARRRIYDIAGSEDLVLQGNVQSEGGVGASPEHTWTPSYLDAPPEQRNAFNGTSIPSASDFGFVTGYGAARSGATAPHANRIRNADMSRGVNSPTGAGSALFWTRNGGLWVSGRESPFVTGGASTRLRAVVNGVLEYLSQVVTVDTGVRACTVGVRYQLLTAGTHRFYIELRDVDANARLAFHYDTGTGPTGWRVRTLTGRFDQLAAGVVGPRRLEVRLHPYNAATVLVRDVLIDSVWLVDGEYGPPFRPYANAVEILDGDNRQTFFTGSTTANVGPVVAMPTHVPANAIGMVVEMRVQGAQAGATSTILRVNDNGGADPIRDVHAFVNARPTIVEYTVPLVSGSPPQWSVVGATVANPVTYNVRLKQWILRL